MPHVPRQREDRRARHATPLPQAAATAMTAGPRVAIRNTQDEIARRRAERRDRVVPLSGRAGVASRSAHAQLSGRADFRRGSAARCRAGTGTSGQHRSGTRWPGRRPAAVLAVPGAMRPGHDQLTAVVGDHVTGRTCSAGTGSGCAALTGTPRLRGLQPGVLPSPRSGHSYGRPCGGRTIPGASRKS